MIESTVRYEEKDIEQKALCTHRLKEGEHLMHENVTGEAFYLRGARLRVPNVRENWTPETRRIARSCVASRLAALFEGRPTTDLRDSASTSGSRDGHAALLSAFAPT